LFESPRASSSNISASREVNPSAFVPLEGVRKERTTMRAMDPSLTLAHILEDKAV
jgi:hypothetical protein